jgi:hypothetical protein
MNIWETFGELPGNKTHLIAEKHGALAKPLLWVRAFRIF